MAKPHLLDLYQRLFKTLPQDLAIQIVPSHSQWTGRTEDSKNSQSTRSSYSSQEQITSLRSMLWYRPYLSYEENFILSLGTSASDWEISQWMMPTRFVSHPELLLSPALSEIQRLGHGLRHYEAESGMFVGHPARFAAEKKMEEYIQSLRRVLNRPQLARFQAELDHGLRNSVSHRLYERIKNQSGSTGGSGGSCHGAHY